MIERNKNNDEEDVAALLPWYEKGTLPTMDERAVEDYLKAHPEDGNRFIELIREEVAETIEANEQAGMPSSAALNRLMDAIAAEPKRPSVWCVSALRGSSPGCSARALRPGCRQRRQRHVS